MFTLHINDICASAVNCQTRFYADDAILYAYAPSVGQTESDLEWSEIPEKPWTGSKWVLDQIHVKNQVKEVWSRSSNRSLSFKSCRESEN